MPSAAWACGSAMFTMVASRMTINCERAMTASASQRFGSSARLSAFSSDAGTLLTSSGGGVDTLAPGCTAMGSTDTPMVSVECETPIGRQTNRCGDATGATPRSEYCPPHRQPVNFFPLHSARSGTQLGGDASHLRRCADPPPGRGRQQRSPEGVAMPELEQVVLLVVGVVIVNGIAARIRVPSPILLVIAGIAVSFIPAVPTVEVDPDVVLAVLLPPLLYAAAVESSVVAIRRALRAITQLAVGMVLVTAFAVAVVLHALIPAIPFAAAVALGAIVAPPDAVASVAIARKAGLPRTAVTVLEGESLFNDATSLVLLKVAIAGISVGTLAWGPAIGEFAWAAAGGVLIGAALGLVLSLVRRSIKSTLSITALSLVTPWLAYLIGESALASGVLTVVVTGLVLGFRSPADLPPEVRLTDGATWNSLQYVLEGSVFALIGLQLWDIVTAPDIGRAPTLLTAAAVLATVIVVRPLWIFLLTGLAH